MAQETLHTQITHLPPVRRHATRRALLGAAGGVGLAVLTAACGASGAPSSNTTVKSSQPVTLDWSSWATDDYGKFREQQRIDIWKQLYPDSNISINMNNFASGEYMTKVQAMLVSGTGPDVFRLSWSNVFPLKEQGAIAELDPYFKKNPKSWLGRADLKKWIVDGARYGGKLYEERRPGWTHRGSAGRAIGSSQAPQARKPPAGWQPEGEGQ